MDDELKDFWREEREAQRQRRAQRRPKRIEELVNLLPKGATLEPVNGEYAYRVSLGEIRLTWYPTHQRCQYNGKTFGAGPRQVVALLKKEAARAASEENDDDDDQ